MKQNSQIKKKKKIDNAEKAEMIIAKGLFEQKYSSCSIPYCSENVLVAK